MLFFHISESLNFFFLRTLTWLKKCFSVWKNLSFVNFKLLSPRCCRWETDDHRSVLAGEAEPIATWDSMGRIPRRGKSSPSWRGRDDPFGCTTQLHHNPTSLQRIREEKGKTACWLRVWESWAGPRTKCCYRDPKPIKKIRKISFSKNQFK